jgi:class 3 adenylate cyclase/tetratricopeptide (TPR) repeat protein
MPNAQSLAVDITQWLHTLGLEQYASAFSERHIQADVLVRLTDRDLMHLGIPSGHRKKLLEAITVLLPQHSPSPPTQSPIAHLTSEPGNVPTGERRQITTMFCDLVGSTALSEQLDPEELGEVIQAYQTCCAKIVTEFQGHIAQYMGDGVLIYFGFPRADEHSAGRAVRAALRIIDAVRTLGLRLRIQLQTRAGIATGVVMAGGVPLHAGTQQEMVFGESPNLAARLQAVAEPDSVVVSENTLQLLGNSFLFLDLGYQALKGFAEPVRILRVIREIVPQSRFEALHHAGTAPLLGRENEIGVLLALWRQATAVGGRTMLISGEAGIGKSRIVHALRERIASDPYTLLQYNCSPYHANSDLYPIISQLERDAQFQPDMSPDEKLLALQRLLSEWNTAVGETSPVYAAMLSIPEAGCNPPSDLTPVQRKERTLSVLVDQMVALAERQPVLVVFEDAHWADPTSLEFIGRLITRATQLRLLVIVTARPDFEVPWETQPGFLPLERLSSSHSAELANFISKGKALPQEIMDQIVSKTDGVPLFVEELTRTVLTSGLVEEQPDRYVLKKPTLPLTIPGTLRDSLMARLDQLGPAKEIAQICAVIGREFSRDLLLAISSDLSVDLDHALKRLADSQLVFRTSADPGSTYVFKHALIRDVAYESLLKTRRKQLHARIARSIEEQIPDIVESQPELLARHFTAAGLSEPAIEYWSRAAKRALNRAANLEVIGHVQMALEVVASMPNSIERAVQELDLQIMLGAAYRATEGFASLDVENTFIRARKLCATLGRNAELLDVLRGLNSCYYIRGDFQSSRSIANQALDFGLQHEDRNMLMMGHYMNGSTMFWQGQFQSARGELERAISLYDPAQFHGGTLSSQIDPHTFALIHLSWTLWVLGYPDQALHSSARSIALARSLSQPFTLAMSLTWACWTRRCCGEEEVARPLLEELRALTTSHRLTYLDACASYLEGQTRIAQGELGAGLEQVLLAIEELRNQGAGLGLPWLMSLPAETYSRMGKSEEGYRIIGEAMQLIEHNGQYHWQAELYRIKGELLLSLQEDGRDDGVFNLRRAIAIARQQGAKALELRAAVSLGRVLQRRGEIVDARLLLADLVGGFAEGFNTFDVQRAKTLVDELA